MNAALVDRLRKGIASEIFANVTRVIVQVGGVPLFLAFWGSEGYGEWLLLTAILGYLRLSSVGFGQATRNSMAMEVSAGERDRALGYFQSTSLLFLLIGLLVLIGVGLAALAAPAIHDFLNFEILGIDGLQHALLILGCVIAINLQVEVLDAGFRCEGHYGLSTFLIMLSDLVIFALVVAVLLSGGGKVMGLTCYLAGSVFRFVLLRLVLTRYAPWITFGFEKARFETVRTFTLPSLAFMAFPLGQAMSLQGTLIVIGAVLGPSAVVVFNTVRMLSRYTVHLTVTFARIGSPEIAYAYGKGDMALVRQVHWAGVQTGLLGGPSGLRFSRGGHALDPGDLDTRPDRSLARRLSDTARRGSALGGAHARRQRSAGDQQSSALRRGLSGPGYRRSRSRRAADPQVQSARRRPRHPPGRTRRPDLRPAARRSFRRRHRP